MEGNSLITRRKRLLEEEKSTKNIDSKRKRIVDQKKLIFTDLNDDSLIAIFEYLDTDDLINVSEASARLSFGAGLAFRRKCCSEKIVVTNVYEPNPDKVPRSIKLLKHFGHFISKMIIQYESEFRRFDKQIEDAIVENCRNSLLEITFDNADLFSMHEIADPFPSVLKVKFINGKWCNMIADFNMWFPNARSLDLHFEALKFPENSTENVLHILRQNFPSLQHLGLATNVSDDNYDSDHDYIYFSNDDVLEIIRLNPQLKSLKIQNMGSSVLSCINNILPELTHLKLTMDWEGYEFWENDFHNEPPNTLLFQNLKYLRVNFGYSRGLSAELASISTTQLDILKLQHCFEVRGDCIQFVSNNRNMHTLQLSFQCFSAELAVDLLQLFPKLPNLKELEMDYQHNKLNINQLTHMLNSCKSLVTAKFKNCLRKEMEVFTKSTLTGKLVGTNWKIAIQWCNSMVVMNRIPLST